MGVSGFHSMNLREDFFRKNGNGTQHKVKDEINYISQQLLNSRPERS